MCTLINTLIMLSLLQWHCVHISDVEKNSNLHLYASTVPRKWQKSLKLVMWTAS